MNDHLGGDYFLRVAKLVSSRSTCPRARVGAIIVRDNRIIATGYNGSPSGEPHCTEAGCDMQNGHCVRTIHAEVNAIGQAAKFGVPVDGAEMYLYAKQANGKFFNEPCPNCKKVIQSAGLRAVYTAQEDFEYES